MKLKPGIYRCLKEKAYHLKLEGYVSKSSLSKFALNPRKAEMPFETTPAMVLGSAFHCKLLQPELWGEEYAIGLAIDKRSKANKKIWSDFLEINQHKTIIKPADYQKIADMLAAVKGHEIAADWLQEGNPEVTLIGELEGLPAKARLDYLHNNNMTIVDIKTVVDGGVKEFAKSIAKYKYHWQAAIYIDLLKQHIDINNTPIEWKFIVVEKTEPYLVYTYTLDAIAIEQGRAEYKETIAEYIKYLNAGKIIPCVDETISLPAWAKREIKFSGLKAEG